MNGRARIARPVRLRERLRGLRRGAGERRDSAGAVAVPDRSVESDDGSERTLPLRSPPAGSSLGLRSIAVRSRRARAPLRYRAPTTSRCDPATPLSPARVARNRPVSIVVSVPSAVSQRGVLRPDGRTAPISATGSAGVRVDLQADERPAHRPIGPMIQRSCLDGDRCTVGSGERRATRTSRHAPLANGTPRTTGQPFSGTASGEPDAKRVTTSSGINEGRKAGVRKGGRHCGGSKQYRG